MTYVAKSGDCLWNIAKEQCGATTNAEIIAKVNEIAQLNGKADPNLLMVGEELKLPGDTFQPSNPAPAEAQTGGANTPTSLAAILSDDQGNGEQTGALPMPTLDFGNLMDWLFGCKDIIESEDQEAIDLMETDYSMGVGADEIEANLKNIANGMFQEVGSKDGQEGINFNEFEGWFRSVITSDENKMLDKRTDKFQEAFNQLDANNNGVLSEDEVANMFKKLDLFDTRHDGRLSNKDITDPHNWIKGKFN